MTDRPHAPARERGFPSAILGLALCVLCQPARAVPGTLRTTDGKSVQGEIAIEAGGFKVTSPNRIVENFELSRVALVEMPTDKPAREDAGSRRDPIPKEGSSSASRPATNTLPTRRGVLLWDGTFLTWSVRGANDRTVRLGGPKEIEVPWSQVARLSFADLTPEMLARVPTGRAGALVAGREFVEGEVKSIADQRVTISSVLFGLRTLEGDQRATAVFLRAVTPRRCRYEIKLRNGSCLRADLFDCEKGGFVLRDGVLRGTRINTWELLELRLLPGTKPR